MGNEITMASNDCTASVGKQIKRKRFILIALQGRFNRGTEPFPQSHLFTKDTSRWTCCQGLNPFLQHNSNPLVTGGVTDEETEDNCNQSVVFIGNNFPFIAVDFSTFQLNKKFPHLHTITAITGGICPQRLSGTWLPHLIKHGPVTLSVPWAAV